eukprot:TRINITY_DN17956_c0_g2_i1.p1 TRINITY_DN17956_c0_g2~~TRINITY_DN17956_c0_g2_i1.p1  ORF type:complete len:425 (+),score=70.69 TRINITY_DN17956_c0_g2_i1:169-1443(+)
MAATTSDGCQKQSPCRYDWLGVHEQMLRDKPRVDAYRRAIMANRADFHGKRVMEVGCGTGILSVFCAKAGAAVVYAVDAEESCVRMTRRVAEANGVGHIVEAIHGLVEQVSLPSKVDIIVSEWMGYLLLYENMLDAVLSARSRFLVPGGIVFPTIVELFIAPFSDAPMVAERERFWSDVGGVDLSSLLPEVVEEFAAEPRIEGIRFDLLLTEPFLLWRYDFRSDEPPDYRCIQAKASWHCPAAATAHGYVGWFDCHFETAPLSKQVPGQDAAQFAAHLADLFKSRFAPASEAAAPEVDVKPDGAAAAAPDGVDVKRRRIERPLSTTQDRQTLSTAPDKPRTHWHQTLFFLREPVPGDAIVDASFSVRLDTGARGWVTVALAQEVQQRGTGQGKTQKQEWLLRSYAHEGMQAPPLPTSRSCFYSG